MARLDTPRRLRGLRGALLLLGSLGLSALSAAELKLEWNDNSKNEDGFQVERALGSTGSFAVVAKLAANTTSYVDTNLEPGTTYRYRVCAFNAVGKSTYSNMIATTTEAAAPVGPNTAPLLTAIPAQSLRSGESRTVSFTVTDTTTSLAKLQFVATSSDPRLIPQDKLVISGTGATRSLSLAAASGSAGTTTVTVAVHDGEFVTYQRFKVTVTGGTALAPVTTTYRSRLSRISLLGWAGSSESLRLDFSTEGTNKELLIRAVGPTLSSALNLSTGVRDPRFTLNRGKTLLGSNNNWGGTAALRSTFTRLGAFALSNSSKDAALETKVSAGDSWISVVGAGGQPSGHVLAEIYDASTDTLPSSRITRVTSRTHVGQGDSAPVLGVTITGSESRTVLVRALAAGIDSSTTLERPLIEVYRDSTRTHRIEGWAPSAGLIQATTQVGATDLNHLSDAAALLTLEPGAYTFTISCGSGAAGTGSIELYEVR